MQKIVFLLLFSFVGTTLWAQDRTFKNLFDIYQYKKEIMSAYISHEMLLSLSKQNDGSSIADRLNGVSGVYILVAPHIDTTFKANFKRLTSKHPYRMLSRTKDMKREFSYYVIDWNDDVKSDLYSEILLFSFDGKEQVVIALTGRLNLSIAQHFIGIKHTMKQ